MRDWLETSLGGVLIRVRRRVPVNEGETYPAVSVKRDGQGLGPKEPFVGGVTNYTTLYRVRKGDVVLRTITAFEAPVGVAEFVHDGSHVSQVFLTYEVQDTVLPSYLRLVFQTPRFWREMQQRATGSVLRRKTISDSAFTGIPIRLPSLPEQRRIVDLLAILDANIEALDEEADALLDLVRLRRSELVNDDDAPVVRAEEAFEFSTGVRRTPERARGPHMTPYLRSANIGYGSLDLSDVQQMNYEAHEREKFGLRYGDVLVSEGSASRKAVGLPAMWRDELPQPVCFQMTLLRLRAIDNVCVPGFVFHWCMWAYESGSFLDVAGGTSIKHISAKRSSQMLVRLPSILRQQEIAQELDSMTAGLDAIRAEVAALRSFRFDLLTSLVSQEIEVPEAYDDLLEVVS